MNKDMSGIQPRVKEELGKKIDRIKVDITNLETSADLPSVITKINEIIIVLKGA